MREVILAQALKLAVEHHINRDFPQAEALYRQILAQAPEDARTHNSLGNTLTAMSRLGEVVDCYLLCPQH